MESVPLRERLRRLFDLSTHQDLMVGEMHALGWGRKGRHGGGCVVCWRGRRIGGGG